MTWAAKNMLAVGLVLAILLATGCERESSSLGPRPNMRHAASGVEPTPVRKTTPPNPVATLQPVTSGADVMNATRAAASPVPAASPRTPSADVIERDRSRWRSELRDLETELKELREKARTLSSTQTRERVTQVLAELESKKRTLAERLDHFDDWRTSAALAWQDVRAGFENAFKELRDAYTKAKSHF
jgi:hypothetical protein